MTGADLPSLVYPVKAGDRNPELRHSLRSVARNLPHRDVWIVGHAPPWVRGVQHLATDQVDTKYRNSTGNVRAACEHPDVSDPFVLMNDDFFVLRPTPTVPTLHRGRVSAVAADYRARYGNSAYLTGMDETAALLATLGHPDPLSYELHVPMVVHKAEMLHALDVGAGVPVLHKRTLYGNLAGLGGTEVHDVKVSHRRTWWSRDWQFISTDAGSWQRGPGPFIREAFHDPGPYEGD